MNEMIGYTSEQIVSILKLFKLRNPYRHPHKLLFR